MLEHSTTLPLSAMALLMLLAGSRSFGVERGRVLVEAHCARCHAVGRADASPMLAAPPLRDLHRRYPVESLEEALAEGLVTGHPGKPVFRFEAWEIEDIIDYLKSLEHRRSRQQGLRTLEAVLRLPRITRVTTSPEPQAHRCCRRSGVGPRSECRAD